MPEPRRAMQEANAAMLEIASSTTEDPQDAVDAWAALADGYGQAAESMRNPEVKAATETVHTDLVSLVDEMGKVFVDQDMGAMANYTTARPLPRTDLQGLPIRAGRVRLEHVHV